MLSSTAANLFWAARYVERADNVARVLEAALRIALITREREKPQVWESVAAIYGQDATARSRPDGGTLEGLLQFMCFDRDNPSSIFVSLLAARTNSRAERNNLSREVWEGLNEAWHVCRDAARRPMSEDQYAAFLDRIKAQCLLVAGGVQSTMLRDDAFCFLRLGTHIERADNTARLLDVKYHILLPGGEDPGSAVDHFHWLEILGCVSAQRIYRRVYRSRIEPWKVAELLILRADVPRSLCFCLQTVTEDLEHLSKFYGTRHEVHRLAGALGARLRYDRIDRIFQVGLHEYLTEFITSNAQLSRELARNYLLET